MKITKTVFVLLIAFLIGGCGETVEQDDPVNKDRTSEVLEQATSFFNTFSERADWEKFCAFYREDLGFHDVLLQIHLDSLWQFQRFYDWPDTNFRKLTPDQDHLTVRSLVANDSMAVATGRINPFYWQGELKDLPWGMEFTIWLKFDENLKIYHQTDWFEYEPLVLESVIDRYRKVGVDKPPDWLDLSR